jgi:thiaminase
MLQGHPGTRLDLTASTSTLTTHLLSVSHDQLLRITHHQFLARAANGTLPKQLVERWLSNDLQYIQIYKGLGKHTIGILRRAKATREFEVVENRMTAWLEAAILNGEREERLFADVAGRYAMDITLTESTKNEGLRLYENLYCAVTTSKNPEFLPWLEPAIILWAMEKVYYEAWSWAQQQDAQSAPQTYEKDQDGGAMRKEFIPNWANDAFLAFVQQLQHIVDDWIGAAINGDNDLSIQVKSRSERVWKEVLDAEEVFWPDMDGQSL